MRTSQAVAKICGVVYEVVGAFKTDASDLAAFALETLCKCVQCMHGRRGVYRKQLSPLSYTVRDRSKAMTQPKWERQTLIANVWN